MKICLNKCLAVLCLGVILSPLALAQGTSQGYTINYSAGVATGAVSVDLTNLNDANFNAALSNAFSAGGPSMTSLTINMGNLDATKNLQLLGNVVQQATFFSAPVLGNPSANTSLKITIQTNPPLTPTEQANITSQLKSSYIVLGSSNGTYNFIYSSTSNNGLTSTSTEPSLRGSSDDRPI